MFSNLKNWLRRRRQSLEARRLVAALFHHPDALAGTSLKPQHASRWIHVDQDVQDDEIIRVRFGILRHPRPYRFSRQSHRVIEYYTYDVREKKVIREKGFNVTRSEGSDAD